MSLESEAARQPTRRRRGTELQQALLAAAWAELTAKGYDDFTIEAVAERAHTSRAVLYRRWATKVDLIQAALANQGVHNQPRVPDTGALRPDMLQFISEANDERARLGLTLIARLEGFYADAGTNPADLRETFLANRASVTQTMLQRAADRGEIPTAELPPRISRIAFDLYLHELMMTLRPVPQDVIEFIVDEIFLPLVTRPLKEPGG